MFDRTLEKPTFGWPRSTDGTPARRRETAPQAARREPTLARVSILVCDARALRNGQPRGQGRIKIRGAALRTYAPTSALTERVRPTPPRARSSRSATRLAYRVPS